MAATQCHAFQISGVVGGTVKVAVGEAYQDADGRRYLPMLRQPVLVFEASAAEFRTAHKRALTRGLGVAIDTNDPFATAELGLFGLLILARIGTPIRFFGVLPDTRSVGHVSCLISLLGGSRNETTEGRP